MASSMPITRIAFSIPLRTPAHDSDIEWLIGPSESSTRAAISSSASICSATASPARRAICHGHQPDRFDLFTHVDNVCAQRQSLQAVFNVEKLALAYGWSMESEQALHWEQFIPVRFAANRGRSADRPKRLRTTLCFWRG